MDRIDNVAVFSEVAERGSFTEAARRLNRSPAAVTRAVAELEARLGVRLLDRTTRAVNVTEAGQRFLAGARRVLADLAEIEQAAMGQGSAPRGELRVTAPIVFGRRHVLPLVTDFLAQYPDVSVRLTLLDRSVDLVEEGFDVAIRIGTLPDTSAIATRVGSLRRIVVAAPDYLKRRGEPKRPDDLSEHDTIAFLGIESMERWRFNDGEARIKPRLSVNTAEAALDAAMAGFGITRVLSYQQSTRSRTERWCGFCVNMKRNRRRCTRCIPAGGIRRRSCALFWMNWCRDCANVLKASHNRSMGRVHEFCKRQHGGCGAGNHAGADFRQ